MSELPQWKTRRLASRTLRVLERHASKSAALDAFNMTLRPAAEQYIEVADALRTSGTRRQTEYKEGKDAVAGLARALRAWVGQIAALKVIEGFDTGSYADNPSVPDDVINDAEVFISTVQGHVEVNPDTIPFAEAMMADVTAKLELAQKEWLEAEQERTKHQDLIAQNRKLARLFMDHLIPFRRALGSEIGRNHPDYHALRSARISRELPEDPTAAFPGDEVSDVATNETASSPTASNAEGSETNAA